jgi:hypothetical protein
MQVRRGQPEEPYALWIHAAQSQRNSLPACIQFQMSAEPQGPSRIQQCCGCCSQIPCFTCRSRLGHHSMMPCEPPSRVEVVMMHPYHIGLSASSFHRVETSDGSVAHATQHRNSSLSSRGTPRDGRLNRAPVGVGARTMGRRIPALFRALGAVYY